jgi:hypothetical protein
MPSAGGPPPCDEGREPVPDWVLVAQLEPALELDLRIAW